MKKINNTLLLMLVLLLLGCRSDHLAEQTTNPKNLKSNLVSKTISIDQSKHKSILIPRLSEISQTLTHKMRSDGHKLFTANDSISIDTEHIFYTENVDYYNYTFKIKRSNPKLNDPIENILLTPLPMVLIKRF